MINEPLKLSISERKTVHACLRKHADDLVNYLSWINDRPQLPAQERAIEQVKLEVTYVRGLAYRILTEGVKQDD